MVYLLQHILPSGMMWLISRESVLIFVTNVFILPPSLLKKITALRYTSFFAILGIIYVTIVMLSMSIEIKPCDLALSANYICNNGVCEIEANALQATCRGLNACVQTCQQGVSDPVRSSSHAFIFSSTIFLALPLFCYGHCSQVQFIPIVADMKNPTKARVSVVIFFAYVLIFAIYTLNSLAGYMAFCGYSVSMGKGYHHQTGNILDSYDYGNIPILVGRFIIAIALCFTFPLYVIFSFWVLCRDIAFEKSY